MPEQEDTKVTITVKVRASIRKRLRIAAVEEEEDQQDIADRAIEEWLDRHNH